MHAGLGSASITPALPVALAGYGDRRGLATSVHDDLRVHALVLDDGDTTCCLLTFDLLLMARAVSAPIRRAIAAHLDCDEAAVITSCIHTHAGPSALPGTEALGWPVPDGFPALLAERALEAASAAHENLQVVGARFARVDLPGGVAINRRGHALTAGAAVLVLDPVAVIASVGIHPTVTGPPNLAITTDYVGPLRRMLAAASSMPTMFLQGCQGDVNPIEWWESGDPVEWSPVVETYAARLANAIAPAIARAEPSGVSLRIRAPRRLSVPIGDTTLAQLAGARRTRNVELLEWAIGAVTLVALPGEGFHAVERELLAVHGNQLLIAGLAPEWHGYFPRPYTDGYEEGLSLGRDAVDQVIAALQS
jgi:hypothetical protein